MLRILVLIISSLLVAATAQTNPTDQTYRNDRLRFSLTIPGGWNAVEKDKYVGDRAKVLLRLERQPKSNLVLTLVAEDGTGNPGIYRILPEDVLPALKKSLSDEATFIERKEGLLEHIGGQDFARADFRGIAGNKDLITVLLGIVQGNLLKATVIGQTDNDIDEGLKLLRQHLSFDPDWSAGDVTPTAGPKMLVRVSQMVSDPLVKKKVRPTYPPDARQNGVTGSVVLHVIISNEGRVEKIWVLRGDPLLVPMTVNTVRQWEYKPYLLNGQPVSIDTQVTVHYTLER
jgi:TonB family protein